MLSIGLSLISVGVNSFGGGNAAKDFGSVENLLLDVYKRQGLTPSCVSASAIRPAWAGNTVWWSLSGPDYALVNFLCNACLLYTSL